MHELGVVFHIIDSLEEVAKENDVTQIQSVTIEIGEVSTVIPHYLTDCWEYPTVQHGRICPYCGSEKTWLLKGNELNIKEVEVI